MPWCPGCRGEYVEGVARCPACDRELVAELPPEEPPAVHRPRAWSPHLVSLARQPRYAVGYAAGAAGVLRRRPYLFTLPILVVALGILLSFASNFIFAHYTPVGRRQQAQAERWAREAPYKPPELGRVLAMARIPTGAASKALSLQGSPVPEPALSLLWRMLRWWGYEQDWPMNPLVLWLYVTAPGLLLDLPLAALVWAAYYGLVAGAVALRPQVSLVAGARRHFRPVLGVSAVVVVGASVLHELAVWLLARESAPLALLEVTPWLVPVLSIPLGLALVAIVTEGAGVMGSLRRSVVTLGREWAVLLSLLVIAFVPCALVWGASAVVDWVIMGRPWDATSGTLMWGWRSLLMALVGAWFSVAQFLWYADAQRRVKAKAAPRGARRVVA